MQYETKGKYTTLIAFQDLGKYYFFINVTTTNIGLFQSSLYLLWISSSFQDIDSDGLPNYWEMQYGLNPEYGRDAYIDSDSDGYLNKEEYLMNTSPIEDNLFQNIWYHIKEKQIYLGLSLLLSGLLCLFSLYGIRREIT